MTLHRLCQPVAAVPLLLLLLLVGLCAGALVTTAQLDLTSQVALGNVFATSATDQAVALNVGTAVTVSGTGALPFYNNSGVALAWNVTDFFGAVRAQGTVERLPSGSALTVVRPFGLSTRPPAGYFVLNLRLVDRNHSNALLQANFTTFAVLWVPFTFSCATLLVSPCY